METITDAAHQMGTTRMANRSEEGMVDTNCRVFGTENPDAASSAVVPTVIAITLRRLTQTLLMQIRVSAHP